MGRVLRNTGRTFAKAQLVYADGKLIVLDEGGVLALATPTATGLTVVSKVQLLTKVAWTHRCWRDQICTFGTERR